MTFPFALAPLVGAAVITAAVRDIGEGVVLAGAVLAALVYIAALVRKGARAVDKLSDLPGEIEAIKQQSVEQSRQHDNAHREMLVKVDGLASRLDRIERAAQDTEAFDPVRWPYRT